MWSSMIGPLNIFKASMSASEVKVNAAGLMMIAQRLVDRLVDPVDELVFAVRLPEHDRVAFGRFAAKRLDFGRASCARRFPARACRGG